MTSELKAETSRINGAKSRGPVTAAGREKSSQNALKHGGASTRGILLASENPEEFQRLRATYLKIYAPGGLAETALVNQMVTARWRILRLDQVETELLDDEMTRQESLARAFRALADDSKALALAGRYLSRQQRIHDRAYKTLRELQQIRLSKEPSTPVEVTCGWITPEERLARDLRREAAMRICTCGNCSCQGREVRISRDDFDFLPNEPTDDESTPLMAQDPIPFLVPNPAPEGSPAETRPLPSYNGE